jgi:hypothetical protein
VSNFWLARIAEGVLNISTTGERPIDPFNQLLNETSMKHALYAVACLLIAVSSQAQMTEFSVIKVSGSLPAQYQDSTQRLAKLPLTTKTLINIALNQEIRTPVPKNIILAYAGVFDDFGHHSPNPTGPAQLVVYDTNTNQKLATLGVATDRTVIENVVVNRFKRIATATLNIQDSSMGNPTGHFEGGALHVTGTVMRKPNGVATPDNLKVTAVATVTGSMELTFTKGSETKSVTVVIPKGTLRGSGKILGTFVE